MNNKSDKENLLNLNVNKDYSIISNIDLISNDSQTTENKENNIIKKFLSENKLNYLPIKIKSLYILEIISKIKLNLNHNCSKISFNKYISNILINDADCHLVAIFKENMILDYIEEFLRRSYNQKESKERIPKFSKYYKNYLKFFCKPTFKDFRINKIIDRNGEKKAEIYYKNNYQGGKSKDDDENNGFAKSSSSDENIDEKQNKNIKKKDTIENINNLAQLFNDSIKEKIENVTIMTTINSSLNNTLNLKIDNEKIEVFSENKCDKSNDTTLHDIIGIIKNGNNKKNNKTKKNMTDTTQLKKELIQLTKENNIDSNNKNIDNIKNKFKNLKIKPEDNNVNNLNNNINNNNNNNNNKNKSLKLSLNNINKDIKDKIKKIIQNANINKNVIKNNNKNELKKVSPSSLSKNKNISKNRKDTNKNIIINNSDILTVKNKTNSNKKNIKRSRNDGVEFLYKQTYTNTYTNNYNYFNNNNNNIYLKNNKFNSTTLHKNNKKINFKNNKYSSINNNNYLLKYSNNLNYNPFSNNINNNINNISKYYITNSSLDNKATSMKMLESYTVHNNKDGLKNKIKLNKDNLIYKLKSQNLNYNYYNYNNINKYTESINSNNKSNINNDFIIKENNNNISSTKYGHQHYNSLSKKINYKPSLSNKKKNISIDPTNVIGPILIEGNSSLSNKTFNNFNNLNFSKIINNNNLHLNNIKEFKKYYNYNNINNNYNININNQIIINTNSENHSYNTNLKEFMNNNNNKKQDFGLLNLYKGKNLLKSEKKDPLKDILGNNNNLKKYKTRNIKSGLQKYYSNPNNNENESKSKNSLGAYLNNKIIKSYHNKKYSYAQNLYNDNKKLLFLKRKNKNKSTKI